MNLIMNKTRNSLNAVNINKLMFIHMNERVMHRQNEKKKTTKKILQHDEDINEKYFCQMKNFFFNKIRCYSNHSMLMNFSNN